MNPFSKTHDVFQTYVYPILVHVNMDNIIHFKWDLVFDDNNLRRASARLRSWFFGGLGLRRLWIAVICLPPCVQRPLLHEGYGRLSIVSWPGVFQSLVSTCAIWSLIIFGSVEYIEDLLIHGVVCCWPFGQMFGQKVVCSSAIGLLPYELASNKSVALQQATLYMN